MNVAIIGAGNVGRALASALHGAGHDVVLAARDPEKVRQTASDLGVDAAPDPSTAAQRADVVIVAVPSDALPEVAGTLARAVDGKPVVDVSNRIQPDLTAPSNAERLREHLPAARVVKAFNTAFASRHASPPVDGLRPDAYVAGDDPEAKRRVLELAESIGFTPVDAGSLEAARTLEGIGWLNIARNMQGGSWQGALVWVEPGQVRS